MSQTISNSTDNNQTTGYYYTLDDLLTSYGSTWILDILNLYLFTTISVFSLIANLFSFIIFCKMENSLPLNQYLRVYCISNVVLSLVSVFNFLATSYRLISWSNSFWTQAYYNFVYTPISNLSYFFSSALDVVILLERIAIFNKTVKIYLDKLSPTLVCIVLFALCTIIDFPYFFVFAPNLFTGKLDENTSITVWFADITPLAKSQLGRILTFSFYAIRDFINMIVQIALSIFSTVLLKKYLNKKMKIINSNFSNFKQVSKSDTNAVIMVTVVCILSICSHIFMIVSIIYSFFNLNIIVFVLYFVCDFFLTLKGLLDIFVFLTFNKKFRSVSLQIIRSFCGLLNDEVSRTFTST